MVVVCHATRFSISSVLTLQQGMKRSHMLPLPIMLGVLLQTDWPRSDRYTGEELELREESGLGRSMSGIEVACVHPGRMDLDRIHSHTFFEAEPCVERCIWDCRIIVQRFASFSSFY